MEQTFTVTTMVTDSMTAVNVKSGELPVLATPIMIAEMERAASNCIMTVLPSGKSSVGTEISVKHLSATPVTAVIKVQATLISLDEKRATFNLTAWDEQGIIGEGTHTRAIVDIERFMNRVNEKLVKTDK